MNGCSLGMSASWATPGSVIETSNQMDDDSKILRQKKFEQQRAIQQQRQQQKRQVNIQFKQIHYITYHLTCH